MPHDSLTGLSGHALLLDRLEQSLIRARTRGTLVTLVLITGPGVLAVLAEHEFGDGSPIAELISQLVGTGPGVHW